MDKIITKNIILFMFILILGGCGISQPKYRYRFNSKQFNLINNQINNWQLKGKISWHHKPTKEAAMCYMDWQKTDQTSRIVFRSAMNIKNVIIESTNGKISVLGGSNKNISEVERNIDNLSKIISLNINHLNYWLLGVPDLKEKYMLIKNGFKQQDWEIVYEEYKSYGDFMFPTTITMSNSKSQTVIKAVINSVLVN